MSWGIVGMLAILCLGADDTDETSPWVAESQQRLVPSEASSHAQFGGEVALEGDTAVVAAHEERVEQVDNVGAVHVYTRDVDTWRRQARLTPPETAPVTLGYQLAAEGDTILAASVERVHIYAREGNTWRHHGHLSPPESSAETAPRPASLALSNDTAAVGRRRSRPDGPGPRQFDAIDLYRRSEGEWTYEATLDPADNEGIFRPSIALDGDRIAVGSIAKDPARDVVDVYVREDNGWRRQTRLSELDPGESGGLGEQIALDGDTLAVGAPRLEQRRNRRDVPEAGAAYVYHRTDEGWRLQTELELSIADVEAEARFGTSLGLQGHILLVGAPRQNRGDTIDTGRVYGYTRNDDQWLGQVMPPADEADTTLAPSDVEKGDAFGSSIDVDGHRALVGAPGTDRDDDENVGAAYLYQLDGCPDSDTFAPGACGCDTPDDDADGDGLPDCNDPCPMRADEGGDAGRSGCPPAPGASDAGNMTTADTGTEEGPGSGAEESDVSNRETPSEEDGCGCRASGGSPMSGGAIVGLLVGLVYVVRRRKAHRS